MDSTVKKELIICLKASISLLSMFFVGISVAILFSNLNWMVLIIAMISSYLSLSLIISALKLKGESE